MSRGDRGKGTEGLTTALAIIFGFTLLIALVFPPLPSGQDEPRKSTYTTECTNAERAYTFFSGSSEGNKETAEYEEEHTKYKKDVTDWCGLMVEYLAAEAGAKSTDFTRLAMIAAFAGVFLLLITLWQAYLMLVEAKKATKCAEDAIDVSKRLGEKQVKAYIGIDCEIIKNLCTSNSFGVNIIIKNSGLSPASCIYSQSFVGIFPVNKADFSKCRAHRIVKSGITLSSGQDFIFKISRAYGEPTVTELEETKRQLFCFGEVTYVDVFGVSETIKWAFKIDGIGHERFEVTAYQR